MLVLASGFTRPAVEAEADKALAERDLVATAVNLFDRGTYFWCNFEPDIVVESAPCQILMSVKAAHPGSQVCEAARGLTDTSQTGLLLLSKAGLQQEVKQLQHQIELLSQANKAIFMSGFDA
ncbi:TPA: hypothetical protein ACH3X2_008509 [Trebouxia sp. C0005]